MIKQIRRGVFETNSSSSHSISVDSSGECKYDLCVEKGRVNAPCGEFGWEEVSYNDSRTKLSYLVTALVSTVRDYVDNSKKRLPFEELIKTSSHYNEYLQLCEVIKECCNANLIVLPEIDGYQSLGYIDHASIDVAFDNVLSKGHSIIRQFLFSDKSILYIDNDNH